MAIEVDLSKSTLDDWNLVSGAQNGRFDLAAMPAWLEFLGRVLVGGTAAYSMDKLPDVIKAVAEKLNTLANPADGQGNGSTSG
jgi:hypothetical protein